MMTPDSIGASTGIQAILCCTVLNLVSGVVAAPQEHPSQVYLALDSRGFLAPYQAASADVTTAAHQPAFIIYPAQPSPDFKTIQNYHDAAVIVSDLAADQKKPDTAESVPQSGVHNAQLTAFPHGSLVKQGFHPASDRQSNWFYGLNIPSPMTLLMEPIGSIMAPISQTLATSSLSAGNLPSLEQLLSAGTLPLVAPKPSPPISNPQPSFRGAAINRRARATLSISTTPTRAGEAFFYQTTSSDDVTVIFMIAGGANQAKDVFVNTNTLPPTCTGATATSVYNPQNAVNGGYIVKGTAAASSASVISKQISNTIISLYDPYNIIGRTLVVTLTATPATAEACGVIVEV